MKLQLALARAKAAQAEGPPGQKLNRRIVWAPKILDEGGAAPAGPAVERDPLKALERFDQQIATDKIDGDILSKFIEFLFQYLTETAPKPVVTAAAGNKLDLYLSYHAADEDYAGAIAQALLESSVKPRIPVADSDADARRYNSDLLAKCDAVTLCWGNASEVWVRSEADRLSDWQALGRKGQFAFRGLIAGPPPASHKKKSTLSLIFQDGEFDKVIDLVETGPADGAIAGGPRLGAKPQAMSAVEISDAAAHDEPPGETAPATAAAPRSAGRRDAAFQRAAVSRPASFLLRRPRLLLRARASGLCALPARGERPLHRRDRRFRQRQVVAGACGTSGPARR